MAEKIEFDLEVKNNDLNKALDDGTRKAFNLEKSLETALGVFGGGLALKGFELLGDAIGSAIDFSKESIKAFTEQEDALNKLGQALKASGDFSEGAINSLSDFASELQRTSKFGDELVLSQLAVAKSLGATNERSKELVQAAANLSSTFGGSLEENVLKLGKTLSGEVGRLGQLIPELKGLTDEQLRAGDAALIVNQRFGGAAASELNTYSGSVIAAKNAFSDLQEEVGGLIVETLDLSAANSGLSFIYNQITEAIQDYNIAQNRANGNLTESDRSIQQLKTQLQDLQVEYIDLEQKLLKPGIEKAAILNAQPILNRLNREISETKNQLEAAQAVIAKNKTESAAPAVVAENLSAQEIEAQKRINNEIVLLRQQLEIDKRDTETQGANLRIEDEVLRSQAEIQRVYELELAKAEAIAQAKAATAEQTLSGSAQVLELEKINAEKEIAINKAKNAKILADTKIAVDSEKKISNEKAKAEIENIQRVGSVTAQVASLASSIAKDGSKEQFLINKAASFAQIAIARATGNANALLLPPPAQPAAIAFANATAALSAAQVAATAIKGFANGGIVGATQGPDNQLATVRTGEIILNANQQKNLFDAINNGTLGGGEIVVQVDGREIARAVRDQMKQGFKF